VPCIGNGTAGKEGPATRVEQACVVDRNCLDDLQWFAANEPRVVVRALEMMELVMRDPNATEGLGKPESLKGLPNSWSRRLTSEHRLVYLVQRDRVVFLAARYHYGE
jgi:toxin YoeB